MKTLIISDSHSKNPVDFIRSKINEGIEQLAFLGDCDLPDILEEILALPLKKIVLSGNHEYEFSKSLDIDSSLLKGPLIRYIELWQSSKAKDFVLNPENHLAERTLSGEKIVFSHGCLAALETSNPLLEGRIAPALYSGNVPYNFRQMQEKNYWILFRGHDHDPYILSFPRHENPFSIAPKKEQNAVTFSKDRLYIVTIGTFIHNRYSILDHEKMTVELKTDEF